MVDDNKVNDEVVDMDDELESEIEDVDLDDDVDDSKEKDLDEIEPRTKNGSLD
jgi:hypothetical protein